MYVCMYDVVVCDVMCGWMDVCCVLVCDVWMYLCSVRVCVRARVCVCVCVYVCVCVDEAKMWTCESGRGLVWKLV
jgi:hypothetical protein